MKNIYPDITMLVPLAAIFWVTVDELLGYDEAEAKADVDKILEEYNRLGDHGRFTTEKTGCPRQKKLSALHYGHVYGDKAGGNAGNDTETLFKK